MKYAILPTAADRRASRRRVVKFTGRVQTIKFVAELECGHRAYYTRSAARQHDHPKTIGCDECAQKLADARAARSAGKP